MVTHNKVEHGDTIIGESIMFDGKGIFVWLGSIILSVIFFTTLGFVGSRMLQVGQRQKAKKYELNKEKYGIEKAERLKKWQPIIDNLIKLALLAAAVLFTIWWCNR